MKKLFLLLICTIVFGCAETEQKEYTINDKGVAEVVIPKFEYHVGDVVYMKPDSTKAVIDYINDNKQLDIRFFTRDEFKSQQYVKPELIYCKTK